MTGVDEVVPDGVAPRRVAVIGATSLIGDFLLPQLIKAGYDVHALSRNAKTQEISDGVSWHQADISGDVPYILSEVDVLIHLAPLATLPPILESLGGRMPRRIIAFGTTSLFTKGKSKLPLEQELVRGLKDSEERLSVIGKQFGMNWTVFRPTLVYHLGRDKNVTTIAYFLKKFGFFALVGGGKGKRQPVHAEDLALATVSAIGNGKTFNKAYNLSGAEVLSYRDMVVRVSKSLGMRPRIIDIPLPLLQFVISVASKVPRFRYLNTEMATRILLDMCFDHAEATTDFGYSPRRFLSDPEE